MSATLHSPARAIRTGPSPATIAAALLAFVVAWFVYGVLSHQGSVLHDDVTEAYVWGQEFQLGYHQHPPFWAWVAGAWFLVFPNRDWAFLLLAVLNAALGLLGAWRLIGRFATGRERVVATILLLVMPYYTFRCYKYNADAIFLSIWPWMAFWFLRAMDTRAKRDAVLFGVMIGLAFLSKYFAVVLLLTCFAASFLHAQCRAYWRSASPWISAAVAAALLVPHAVWLVANRAPPVEYALSISHFGLLETLWRSVAILADMLALLIPLAALIWITRRRAASSGRGPDFALLALLAVLPTLLTVAFGVALGMKLRSAMVTGLFPLAPLLLIRLTPGADLSRLSRWGSRIVVAGTALVVLSAPLVARYVDRPRDADWTLPLREASETGAQLWHEATHRPVKLVGGSWDFSNAAAFYDDDRPSGFVNLDQRRALWVTPERIRRDGLLVLCVRSDVECHRKAEEYSVGRPPVPRTLVHAPFGPTRGQAVVDFYVIPPAALPVATSASGAVAGR